MRKPIDQVVVLEALALGFAFASKEHAARIFGEFPSACWVGPLAGMAVDLESGREVNPDILGISTKPGISLMRAIVGELIVAETERRRRSMAERMRLVADKILLSQNPGPNNLAMPGELDKLLTEARGLYETKRTVTDKDAASRKLEKASSKASGSH